MGTMYFICDKMQTDATWHKHRVEMQIYYSQTLSAMVSMIEKKKKEK